MDIKKILSIIAIAICAIVLTACSSFVPLKENPNEKDIVYSNGGIAVQKGEYLYYANGFLSQADLKYGDNSFGNIKYSGIYRTKLNNGSLVLDDDGVISNSECVVPKVVGYEQGNFYIFDNYIFYSSPNGQKDKHGALQNALMDFYMADISGANTRKLYTTEGEYSTVKYGMKKYGDTVYLLILDKIKKSDNSTTTVLRKITIKNGRVGAVITLDENVGDALWTEQSTYNANLTYNNEFDSFIYYTVSRDADDEGAGNILKKVSIVSNETATLINDNVTTFSLKAINSDRIYYTTTKGNIQDVLYANTLSARDVRDSQTLIVNNAYSKYYQVQGEAQNYAGGIIVSDSTKGTKFISNIDYSEKIISSSEQYNVLFNLGSKVYLRSSGSMIYVADLSSDTIILQEILANDKSAKTSDNKYVDYTNRYVLYYGEYKNDKDETKYYMHIVDTNIIDSETSLPKDLLLASLLDEDVLSEEEDDE